MKQLISLVFLAILLPGCWNGQKQEKMGGLVVVNVLDEEFYTDCHIKGSVNIPFEQIDQLADTIDKDAQVVLYCSNYQCTSSEYAAKMLRDKGFSNVCVYEAGMAEWYQKGLPVEGKHMKAYLTKPSRQIVQDSSPEIPVISTDELAKKMKVTSPDSITAA